jgi:hypothetical protein
MEMVVKATLLSLSSLALPNLIVSGGHMKTTKRISKRALLALPLLLSLLFAQNVWAQATVTQAVGVTSTVYLTIGGPYGSTDLTAVTGAVDLVITDSGAAGEMLATETVTLSLPSTSWEWVPGDCVATVSGGGGNVTFAAGASAQDLVATLNVGAIPAAGNITFTVLAARSASTVVDVVAATAIAATANTFTSMTNAAWGTTVAVVAAPSLTFTTPASAGSDSTDLADGDGGWDFGAVYTLTTHNNGADADIQLWWSVDSSLTSVNDEEGAFRALRDSSNQEVNLWVDVSAAPTTATPLTASLSDYFVNGVEYYLYATSLESGDRSIGRAGPIRAFHYPTNDLDQDDPNSTDTAVDFTSSDDDYLDSGLLLALDDGTEDGSGVDNVTWDLTTIDFDHNADVDFYYSTSAILTESDLVLSGSSGSYVVTALTGATLIAGTDSLEEDVDYTYNWDIYASDTDYVAAGAYYIYVVSNDAYYQDVDVSSDLYNVSHSPILIMQDPYPDGTTAVFDLRPDVNRYFNVNWGLTVAGDTDPDDNSVIAFYLDADGDVTADFDQTSIATLTSSTTNADDDVTNGELIYTTAVYEDPDHQLNNMADIDMWAWSEALRASINARVALGDNLIVYGIMTSGSLSRVCTYASEDANSVVTAAEDLTNAVVTATNAPDAFITDPPLVGASVGWGEAYRIAYDFAWDFGETNQNILLYVGNEDMNTHGTFDGTWGTGVVGLLDLTNDLWVTNSSDGTVAGNTGTDVIAGLSYDGSHDFEPHTMTGVSVGVVAGQTLAAAVTNAADLYIYLVLSSNASGSAPADGDLVFQAPGTLYLESDAALSTDYTFKMMPNQLSVTQGQSIDFEIYANSGVPTAEIASVFMSCDTTFWDVTSTPFALNETTFSAALVVENSNDDGNVANGLHHLNFVYGANGAADANLNGGTNILCTLTMTAKHTGIVNAVETGIYFDQDPPNGRWTAFIDGTGEFMASHLLVPGANAASFPLGELQGNVDLEGVNDFTSIVSTIAVAPSGAVHGVEEWNTLFSTTNDGDASLPGVQVTLDQAGHYHLLNVPDGEYDFTVHVDGWLDGTVNVQVQHGDHQGDIDPIYSQRITQGLTQQRLQLLAGDCAGYTDSTSTTTPDNQIDATDLTAVKNAYDTQPGDGSWNALCDFERIFSPNWVNIPDLALVNANQGTSGVPLVYRTGQPNNSAIFRLLDVPTFVSAEQEFELSIELADASDVRAFDVRLNLAGLELLGTEMGNLLGDMSQADGLIQHHGDELVIASAQRGHSNVSFAGNGEVATIRLRALESGSPQMMLSSGAVVNDGFETQLTDLDNSAVLPAGYSLSMAYPNPFNPVTTIAFAMPADGFAKLTIFNMLGQQVSEIVSEQLSAGRHHVIWDARNQNGMQVASGVYVYQLEVNDFKQAKTMTLLK